MKIGYLRFKLLKLLFFRFLFVVKVWQINGSKSPRKEHTLRIRIDLSGEVVGESGRVGFMIFRDVLLKSLHG